MRPILIPEYLTEFKCIGGECEDTCCAGWKVTVDKKTYKNYRKLRNSDIAKKLHENIKRDSQANHDAQFAYITFNEEKKCNMLLNDGLCSIQKELGEEHLCNTCFSYPRFFSKVGDHIEKSLSLSCPEAARVVLLRKEGLGFIETEEPKNTRGLLNRTLELEKHPYFWDIRYFVIQLLQDRKHSIEIRLIILGLFLKKIESMSDTEWQKDLGSVAEYYLESLSNDKFIASLNEIEGNLDFQLGFIGILVNFKVDEEVGSERYAKILKQLVEGLNINTETFELEADKIIPKYKEAYYKYYEPFMKENEYIIENYIVNYIFKNLFPYNYNTLFESYSMLVINFIMIKFHLVAITSKTKQMTEEIVIECIQQLTKRVEHNALYLQAIRNGMEELGFNTMGHMFIIIKS